MRDFLNSLSIRHRMYLIAGLSVVSMLLMAGLKVLDVQRTAQFSRALFLVERANTEMLQLRRDEKDFLVRVDLKYAERFGDNVALFKQSLGELDQTLSGMMTLPLEAGEVPGNLNIYAASFLDLVTLQTRVGMNPKDGLYGSLRSTVHQAEAIIKNQHNDRLMKDILMLRRREKDFMLRRDMKYVNKFNKDMAVLRQDIVDSGLGSEVIGEISRDTEKYQVDFIQLVSATQKMGLSSHQGVRSDMRNAAHNLETLLQAYGNKTHQAVAVLEQRQQTIFLVVQALVVVAMLGLILLVIRSVLIPLTQIRETINEIEAQSDMSSRIPITSNDEIAQIGLAFNSMLDNVQGIIRHVTTTLGTNRGQVASSLSETTDHMATMVTMVRKSATHATEVNQRLEKVVESAEVGYEVVDGARQTMQDIAKSSEQIAGIISIIDDITFQTNLLALNAAVEAARAGHSGAGFAVVAEEVRNLAHRSATSSSEIKALIEGSQNLVESGVTQVTHSASTLENIRTEVNEVSQLLSDIATSTSEQSQGIDGVNEQVKHINSIVQDNTKTEKSLEGLAGG